MMKMFFKITLAVVVITMLGSCASYHLRQGNYLYRQLAYSSAIEEYQRALSKKNFPEAQIKLAECYRLTNNISKAEEQYRKVVQLPEASPDHFVEYGQLLMSTGKYDTAAVYFDKYLQLDSSATHHDQAYREAVRERRMSCTVEKINQLKEDSAAYTIQTTNLNSGQSNFCPVWYRGGVVFVSDRASVRKPKNYEWTNRPFLDLYYAKEDRNGNFSTPLPLSGDVNGLYHDGPAAFSPTADTIYFTRNNYVKKKVKKTSDDLVILKMYQAVRKDTAYREVAEFPFNSNNFNTGHPTISSDGNTIYFVNDSVPAMKSDLYVSHRVNNEWSKPENLGSDINTPFNEVFPMIWKDTVLYFSSDGHAGLGGLDLYRSFKRADGWSKPENLGYPVNTSYDDFGIALDDSAKTGLISSNRNTDNTSLDNIYSLTIHKLIFSLDGYVINKLTRIPLDGAVVELRNLRTNQVEKMTTGPDGKFTFLLEPKTDYELNGSKENYFTVSKPVTTKGMRRGESIFDTLQLEHIVINKPIVLENIYYDLDKYNIRPDAAEGLDRLVRIMNENPEIRIELSSHTDSRAEDKYNMELSQKRAESAVQYLISKGIGKDRMVAKGYGETRLVSPCSNGVDCTEEQHQQNRRTEFAVTSMDKKTE